MGVAVLHHPVVLVHPRFPQTGAGSFHGALLEIHGKDLPALPHQLPQ